MAETLIAYKSYDPTDVKVGYDGRRLSVLVVGSALDSERKPVRDVEAYVPVELLSGLIKSNKLQLNAILAIDDADIITSASDLIAGAADEGWSDADAADVKLPLPKVKPPVRAPGSPKLDLLKKALAKRDPGKPSKTLGEYVIIDPKDLGDGFSERMDPSRLERTLLVKDVDGRERLALNVSIFDLPDEYAAGDKVILKDEYVQQITPKLRKRFGLDMSESDENHLIATEELRDMPVERFKRKDPDEVGDPLLRVSSEPMIDDDIDADEGFWKGNSSFKFRAETDPFGSLEILRSTR
jgi:hypothetical protein